MKKLILIKLYLLKGSRLNKLNNEGNSALSSGANANDDIITFAVDTNHVQMVLLLANDEVKAEKALYLAAEKGNFEMVSAFQATAYVCF